jgi:hypothetical protein
MMARQHSSGVAALAASLVLLLSAAAVRASPVYNEALWNGYYKYQANKVHANLMFAGPGQSRLFPLDGGFDVEVRVCASLRSGGVLGAWWQV